jgi:hypothetical protein
MRLMIAATKVLVWALLALSAPCALAADARERGFIQQGMTEAEVLSRIGKPDYEGFILNVMGQPEGKVWTYMPHYRDPQTLTLITLWAGLVEKIDRQVVRAAGPDARERSNIRWGMTEGEVLYWIGRPDHEAVASNATGQPVIKTWTYLPHYRDPQTITIITLRTGIVESIERKISR